MNTDFTDFLWSGCGVALYSQNLRGHQAICYCKAT
jgi:hypothetical protein